MDTRMTKRRNFSETFKTAVALEALRGDKTVQEIAAKLDQLVILDRVW
jgi:transposase